MDNLISKDTQIKLINNSFYITYVFLITTGTITFIEALRTKSPEVRNIMNLETCISIVAAYFYGKFVEKLNDKKIDYEKINETRYTDWAITTPIMLLVLVLAFLFNSNGGRLHFFSFLLILFFNYAMLGAGYLGEQKFIEKYQLILLVLYSLPLYTIIFMLFISKIIIILII